MSSTREIAGEKRGRLVSSARASPPIARERTRETSGSLGSYRNTAGAIGRSFWLASWPSHKKKQATLSHLPSLFLSSLLFLLLLFILKSNAIQVAVQLPMFNERAVCQAIIDSACEMAWPRERFCVQVRRDSFFDGSDFSSCAGRWSTLFCDVSACLTSRRVMREGRASVKGGSLLVLGRAKMSFRFHVFSLTFFFPRVAGGGSRERARGDENNTKGVLFLSLSLSLSSLSLSLSFAFNSFFVSLLLFPRNVKRPRLFRAHNGNKKTLTFVAKKKTTTPTKTPRSSTTRPTRRRATSSMTRSPSGASAASTATRCAAPTGQGTRRGPSRRGSRSWRTTTTSRSSTRTSSPSPIS